MASHTKAPKNLQTPPTGILSYFTRHQTIANLLLVLLLGAGLWAVPNMRAQFFPDVVVDTVTVSVSWSGAGAEDVDAAVVQVLEPTLLAVEGVAQSTATSTEGRGSIRLEFEPGWDIQRGADDIKAAIDTVSSLPDGADDATVRWGGWSDTVTEVVITGPVGIDQLARFADELVIRLFSEGVTRTSISGVAAPETIVEVSTLNLIQYDVSMSDIAAAIGAETDASPAGDVGSGTSRVRAGVAKRSAVQISGIVLRTNDDGSKLTVGDVADVYVEGVDRDRAFYVGQNPAVSVNVSRSDLGDAIGIQSTVQQVTDAMELTLPQGVTLDLFRTRAEAIQARLDLLKINGLMGLGLVALLLFLFLNARTALMVAAGIPVAMLSAIALMYAAGLTFNMISLFALIITLGIVVDDAIVVGEHADFRVRKLGEGPVEAAENAARRMFAPVFSSTVTTIIAFFGLMAISGRFGDLIADIPFTVIVVLLASLAECFLILPNHLSHSIGSTGKLHWYDWPSRQVNKGFRVVRDKLFRPFMVGVIKLRYPVMALALFMLSWQLSLLVTGEVPWRFFNSPERSTVSGNFAMAPGATREDSLAMMREMQRATEQAGKEYEEKHGTNPVAYVVAQIGGGAGRGLSGSDTKETFQLGGISIELIDADLRLYSSGEFVTELQSLVVNHPLAETVSFRGGRFGPGGDAIDVQLFGADSQTLKAAAESLKSKLSQYSEVSALEDDLAYDKEELVLELTAQGEALGFTIETLGRVLSNRLGGIEAATFPDGTRTATVTVQLPSDELKSDFLDQTQMRTPLGQYVPLSDIVSVTRQSGFSTVRRENGLRVVTVSGDLNEDDAARAVEIQATLNDEILPEIEENFGVTQRVAGLAEQENQFLKDAIFGLSAALLGIYLTLAWIFSSWSRPIVVMAVIPFGLIGAIYGHAYWDVPLSMFSVVGLIGMTGIIINDSIVLVTTIDEYAENRGIFPAIIDATTDRLRPVMLTTATTVLGLAPLLFERSADAQFLKPTVITLVYGLGFGMVIVLLMVPAILSMQVDVARYFTSLRRAVQKPQRFGRATFVLWGAMCLALAWFAATIGFVVVTGVLPQILGGGGIWVAALVFLVGLATGLVAIYLSVSMVLHMRHRA
ncbi:efflux RND transporter permease subunit [Pacificibacter marinus]|uniref:Putative efflux pump membrane transporter TtgB n=1 Tax=Pacificibacter marinus TaxID=658057 RepID=A0A1Y5TJL0_9RHOB|nr:efflux RND transporter permease subunit [Pacificibacter marinus]SEL17866.1 Multidrug efflux pump subunit AcrB [Pacificibacter marinus]SLN63483.1 putative efflux pump membrane transporter TtgB [Pacificibacter marinus]